MNSISALINLVTELTPDTGATFTTTLVIAGIITVVFVLILLIVILKLFGVIMTKVPSSEKKEESGDVGNIPTPALKTKSVQQKKSSPAEYVEPGIPEEIVAVIAAAVAASEGQDVVIRSVKRVNVSGRNPWAFAAVSDNTMPF